MTELSGFRRGLTGTSGDGSEKEEDDMPAHVFRRAATVTVALATMAVSACADESDGGAVDNEETTKTTAETTAPQEKYFADSEYVGETVTVTAAVETDLTDESVVLNANDYGDESLLVLYRSDQPAFEQGDVVTAEGTVRRFSYDEMSETYGLAESAMYEVFADEAFLMADSLSVDSPGG
ncbi:hypothetical protein [Actinophytocola glycyrrhizae]|uniref:Uncharacterized protein n=1 Tax=Actinophytocola glycyrrhizae TaxID=2044873 RepID=A0ABV9RZU9_9PSEU